MADLDARLFVLTKLRVDLAVHAADLTAQLAAVRADYPPAAVTSSFNLIDSHDTVRALTDAGGDKNTLRLMALLQFTTPGAPTIYYGDEAGMTGGKDPDDRRTYPGGSLAAPVHAGL